MKAVAYDRFGPPEVLEVREVPKPEPKEHEVLIRIRATTVTSGDHRARSLDAPAGFGLASRLYFGPFRPRRPILGSELAGDVESVGRGVRDFRAGDAVFAFTGPELGCHAEYRCMAHDGRVARKPTRLTYAEAAALPFGGLTALHFLRNGNVRCGEKVLVNGASGTVGTACVQLARHLGAEVTGVCSTGNLELVRSLGAAHVVDYTCEDFTRNGVTYDVVVDTVGTAPFSRCKASLAPRGRLLLVLASVPDILSSPWVSRTSDRRIIPGVAPGNRDDLQLLAELAESGELQPVVDRSYPLDRIVEAHQYVDSGRKRGAVVIGVA
jgi:NADPH:quinone reductase-like Zn-dependent oxidoreductase